MCGIGGILGHGCSSVDRISAARRLQQALRHRGPDDEGIVTTRQEKATLVQTRLAILDLGPAGRQPFARGSYWIVFNGEIYNHRELRAELESSGEVFVSTTDTEVLLAWYIRHGIDALARLRGMFAFAIWNEEDQSCFLARDPFGIKPLYHGRNSDRDFIFASELRALLATGMIERRLDPAGLESYLASGSVAEPHTMVQGVRLLEAGHWMRWHRGKVHGARYAFLDFAEEACEELEVVDRTRTAILDSMEHHLISDVPVGIFLSGGLDSAALLAAARLKTSTDLATFSVGVEDKRLDETTPARRLAEHFGTRHHEFLLTQEMAHHWIDPFFESLDQPTVDGFNTYCASKLAADHGFKVVLSGIGGDELFGGYPSFRHIPRMAALGGALERLGSPARFIASRWERAVSSPLQRRMADYLSGPSSVNRAYHSFRGIFSARERAVIRQRLFGNAESSSYQEVDGSSPDDFRNSISRLELTRYMRNQLLRDADVLSMRHGLELRTPLLDGPLFSVLRTIPPDLRFEGDKKLLRKALPEIPSWHAAESKRGFTLPCHRWFHDRWEQTHARLPFLPHVSFDSWSRKWAVTVFQNWMQRHGLTI